MIIKYKIFLKDITKEKKLVFKYQYKLKNLP